MKNLYKNVKNWCNVNQGLLTLFAIIVTIIGLIPFNKIDFGFTSTLFDKVLILITYSIKIPAYLLLIVIFIAYGFVIRTKRKYKFNKISKEFLEGNWKNEWNNNGNSGWEICSIKIDGKYFVDSKHYFTIEDFKYDSKTNKINFNKIAVQPNDDRKLQNSLKIVNNDLIIGKENGYEIKYTRL